MTSKKRAQIFNTDDLGGAFDWSCRVGNLIQPIRNTTQIWVVTRHQYGISALVSQPSFGGKTSGSVSKCRLFSQALSGYTDVITITPGKCQLYIQTVNGQSPLSEREGNWSRDASRNGFWGRYWGSVGHLLVQKSCESQFGSFSFSFLKWRLHARLAPLFEVAHSKMKKSCGDLQRGTSASFS